MLGVTACAILQRVVADGAGALAEPAPHLLGDPVEDVGQALLSPSLLLHREELPVGHGVDGLDLEGEDVAEPVKRPHEERADPGELPELPPQPLVDAARDLLARHPQDVPHAGAREDVEDLRFLQAT